MSQKHRHRPQTPKQAQSHEHVQATLQRRRSGAAGSHDSRPNRERTRANVKRAAIAADW